MKIAAIHMSIITALVLGLSTPVDAQRVQFQLSIGQPDSYVVVERSRSGAIVIEEPAPRVVIVDAPPPPPRRVVVRPAPPCVGAIWVEGYWQYTGLRFVWVRGHWVAPRDGYRFVQPRWHVHAGYHYYTPGYFRPIYAKVRRRAYHYYRPRPGYVYYRGHQRPVSRRHHPPGHYKHAQHPGRGHYKHVQKPGRGHYKHANHPGRGHYTHTRQPSRY